jgi:hypothetical protein
MMWLGTSPPFLFVMNKLSFLYLHVIPSLWFQILAKTTTVSQKKKVLLLVISEIEKCG